VPGWLVGADPLHGTFKVVQPFGDGAGTSTAGAAARQGNAAAQRPGSSSRGGRAVYSPARERSSSISRRPASAGPCCGGSSSSSGGVAVVAPAAMQVVGCRWGAGGAASVLSAPGGSGSCISSQWLCTGVDAEEQSYQQPHVRQQHQQQQRPRSAAPAVWQRPGSALGHAASSNSNSCLNNIQPSWSAQQRASCSRPGSAAASAAGTSPVACMQARAGGSSGFVTSGCSTGSSSRPLQRPSSCPPHSMSSSVGLAEKRRLAESMRQDLTAVRLLQ
jgi:hypothetical protein